METNFFKDVWNYLYDAYFNIGNGYENLGTQGSPIVTVGVVVFGIYIGAVIACAVMFYNRQVVGSAVRRMLSEEIHSRENAKTLFELGYKKNFFIRGLFRDSISLRKVVKCVEEEDFYAEQEATRAEYEQEREKNKKLPRFRERTYRVDVATDKFYIPEEQKFTAEVKFQKKGSTWVSMLVGIIILTVAFFAILLVLPWFLRGVDDAFGVISGAK